MMKNKIIALCWFAGLGLLSAGMAFFEQRKNFRKSSIALGILSIIVFIQQFILVVSAGIGD